MSESRFALEFSLRLVDRLITGSQFEERRESGGPLMTLVNATDGSSAGYLRLWEAVGESRLDRLVHFRLQSASVDTHLLFVFGKAETAMPHFHAQVVQFAADACVYNADIIPRLDVVDHPAYYSEVFGPVTKAYWKVATDPKNVCAMAPANPAIAAYLSPWSIAAGRPAPRDELERVEPSINAYVDHYLALSRTLSYAGLSVPELRARDQRHMRQLHSDELDPRAWKGVYRVIGESVAHRIKDILSTPIHS